MNTGEIVLIPFPFSELSQVKVRPAVVITETKDKYKDLVVSAISSVLPSKISEREFIIPASDKNNLRVKSVLVREPFFFFQRTVPLLLRGTVRSK